MISWRIILANVLGVIKSQQGNPYNPTRTQWNNREILNIVQWDKPPFLIGAGIFIAMYWFQEESAENHQCIMESWEIPI